MRALTGILIVPDEIADLARRSTAHACLTYEGSPSIARAVLADWLEEQGQLIDLVRYLRPRPAGFHEKAWLRNREWVINAILEAHEKRSELLELKRSRETDMYSSEGDNA